MTNGAMLQTLDMKIQELSLLKHPFYRAWTEGTLPTGSLALYAAQYYQHVAAFPGYLATLESRADSILAPIVRENLDEELHPVSSHPLLWRNFAHSLGVSEAALESAEPLPGIATLVSTYEDLAANAPVAEAVAAFYAYEAQVPEVALEKRKGLARHFGIEAPEAVAYFQVHEEADIRHRAAWREWLAGQRDLDAEKVLASAEKALRAMWGALDAVTPAGYAGN
jgi:pyrroloquinoline-quinone synthase